MGVCKHVVATILAADATGLGESVPGRTALYLEPSPAALDEFANADEDEYAYDDDGDDDAGTRRPSITGSAGRLLAQRPSYSAELPQGRTAKPEGETSSGVAVEKNSRRHGATADE